MRNEHRPERSAMSGAIFMCNKKTRTECFRLNIFGLPSSFDSFVRKIKKGMYLFLFDTDGRRMHGVFEATCDGGNNIVRDAYRQTGSSYPAQVQFKIVWKCTPLTEDEFKPAIRDNYFSFNKFNFQLNLEQVTNLVSLFERRKKITGGTSEEKTVTQFSYTNSSSCNSPHSGSRFETRPDNIPYRNPYPSSNTDLSMRPQNSAGSYHYPYEPDTSGAHTATSSDYTIQNYQHCQYQSSTDTVPNPTNTHPLCEYCSIKNNQSYASSCQPMQTYAPNPEYFPNASRGVATSSSQNHFCNQVPENFYASLFENLKENPIAHQNSSFSNVLHANPNPNPSFSNVLHANPNPNPNPSFSNMFHANPNPSLCSDGEKRQSVFSRLESKKQVDKGPSLNQLLNSLNKKSNNWVNNDKPTKKSSTDIEAKEDLGLDGMVVDSVEPVSERYEPDNIEAPVFFNFKRRSGEKKTSVGPDEEGTQKKRRIVRPSLEIERPVHNFENQNLNHDLQGPICKIDPSEETKIEGFFLGEVPVLQFHEEMKKERTDTLSSDNGKIEIVEKCEVDVTMDDSVLDETFEEKSKKLESEKIEFESENMNMIESKNENLMETNSNYNNSGTVGELVVLDEKTEDKKHVPDAEPFIPKEKLEFETEILKTGMGIAFELRSLIQRAKPENLNEAGTTKNQDDIILEEFIPLE